MPPRLPDRPTGNVSRTVDGWTGLMLWAYSLVCQVELEQRHRKEHAELQRDIQDEKQRVLVSLDEQSQQQVQKTVQQREIEFQRQLAKKQSDLSVGETDRLIATHHEEMAALKYSMEMEKEQQKKVRNMVFCPLSP